ncbi:hypothetical protein [Natrinema caseinilyticum]|uniref:DNA replication complex subunit Gins51 n=1 Tax=Natrinema caseinilyticum TaxID=2961570 RepID=UPI0020C43C61|nr:hypothetical protein [Natrinema caseinilyticum]
MNLDELRSIQSKERQKDSLQNLRPSFYREVGEYIAGLEAERDRVAEQADDPFSSPEVGRLTDEIETAKDVVEAVYERRMGKLVKQASLAAAGMPADDEGLTAEEVDLFDDLVDRISSNKNRVLDVLEGVEDAAGTGSDHESEPQPESESDDSGLSAVESSHESASTDDVPPPPPDEPPADADPTMAEGSGTDTASTVSPAEAMGGDGLSGEDGLPSERESPTETKEGRETTRGSASDSGTDSPPPRAERETEPAEGREGSSTVSPAVERTTVRITSDIGSILGVDDREYTLTSDDVVTLPEQNAVPLIDREAAERLE